ncbi:hypothetical protein BX600DRAFT_196371 [Xylariales sp. PMI_506]|nr:hypothetical protein BX600DRAFT_196371 [Xylariales sp. PMI_506]
MDRTRVPGQLHTPTQSFSESPAAGTPEQILAKTLTINDKKFKEDYDNAKARLSDQKFDIREYPDPLLPRDPASENYLPKGLTPETENYLLEVVARIKGSQA